jgi:hypothetical protein
MVMRTNTDDLKMPLPPKLPRPRTGGVGEIEGSRVHRLNWAKAQKLDSRYAFEPYIGLSARWHGKRHLRTLNEFGWHNWDAYKRQLDSYFAFNPIEHERVLAAYERWLLKHLDCCSTKVQKKLLIAKHYPKAKGSRNVKT